MHTLWNKFFSHKLTWIFLLIILAAGIFLRTYNFSNWLHFEIDQVYDVYAVLPALENGPANLTLLGTNAGGGALRLGPAYYYLQYLSALLFGNTPTGHATFVLIFSLLSLPLFYLFVRHYFNRKISLGLLAVFASSLYLVQYSRFAWSPNILPFLILLAFYALLRSVSEMERRKNFWFLLAVFAITLCTQIHFNALLVVPGTAVLFLLFRRPSLRLKTWLGALFIVLLLYAPVIANEIKTHGENSRYFLKNIAKETRGKEDRSTSLAQAARYNALEYFFIISGNDQINNSSRGRAETFCQDCATNIFLRTLGFGYFFLGILGLILAFLKNPERKSKDFLLLTSLWLIISGFLFYYLIRSGFTMQARFALISAPLAIVLLGFLLELLDVSRNRFRSALFFGIIIILLSSNGLRLKNVFAQLQNAGTQKAKVEQEDIFPNTNRITLAQQSAIVDYLQEKFSQNNYPVFLESNRNEYEATFWYHLERLGKNNPGPINLQKLCAEANYFSLKTIADPRDLAENFNILETQSFGTLNVLHLSPKKEKITCLKSDFARVYTDPEMQAQKMLTWRKLFP
jgi:4-amino-4-deoxy-L-arabinose transferase-like glycosyltransferase